MKIFEFSSAWFLRTRRGACAQGCHTALDNAVMTAPDRRDPAMLAKLDVIVKRVLG